MPDGALPVRGGRGRALRQTGVRRAPPGAERRQDGRPAHGVPVLVSAGCAQRAGEAPAGVREGVPGARAGRRGGVQGGRVQGPQRRRRARQQEGGAGQPQAARRGPQAHDQLEGLKA